MTNNKRKIVQSKRKQKRKSTDERNLILIIVIILVAVAAVVLAIVLGNKKQAQPEASVEVPVTTQYNAPPAMTIDVNKTYLATVTLEKGGEFVIELFPDKAPVTVNNFIFLAKEGFYDGVTFHRVLEGFMAQTGDPTGTGMGGPGYEFANEDSDLVFDKEGVVAMANAGRDTNGSQFFITFGPTEWLNGDYTIFGQVISGMEVVKSLTLRDPNQSPSFTGDAIKTIVISAK
jgi:cyclophilin family peptidyl-prolyl cis-trans isomerase